MKRLLGGCGGRGLASLLLGGCGVIAARWLLRSSNAVEKLSLGSCGVVAEWLQNCS